MIKPLMPVGKVVAAVILSLGAGLCCALEPAHWTNSQGGNGEAELFQRSCAQCHDGGNDRAPRRAALRTMSFDHIYQVLTDGAMRPMAQSLSDGERRQLAAYLTDGNAAQKGANSPPLRCAATLDWFDYGEHPLASGWAIDDLRNTRFIPDAKAQLTQQDVRRLKLKWAFAFPNTNTARSQPAVAGGAIFVGDQAGNLYALNSRLGCVYWQFKAEGFIRTAVTISNWEGNRPRSSEQAPLLYFGDATVHTYALNAATGKLVWKVKVEDHPAAMHTGSATLVQSKNSNRLYVPVSSVEEPAAENPDYVCCSFRGSVTALNADTGEMVWKTYTIPTEPSERGKNARGVAIFGPSGAGVWNSPTIDLKRNRLYIGTGENDSSPAENGGAIMAINLRDGSIAWTFQAYPQEAYNGGCFAKDDANCPKDFRGRFGLDVSASPILLRNKDGREIIVAGQKTGDLFGLDPDMDGKILWRRKISMADFNIGVLWGMAAESGNVFAGVGDAYRNPAEGAYWGMEELGLYALDGFSGKPLWTAPVSRHCRRAVCRGYSAALTAISGVLFAGAKDGFLRAFETGGGSLLWEFNTARDFIATNGEVAHGGALDGPGPIVANGMVYVNSGYASEQFGSVLLAFSIDGK